MNIPNNDSPTSSVSFNSQPYPAYLGGYQTDLVTKTAIALHETHKLKMNVTLHIAHEALMPIVEQTVRHYRHTINRLMQGKWDSADGVAPARESWEGQIGDIDNELEEQLTKHTMMDKKPLVSVWGDAVLLVGKQYYWLSLNKCDETTAANDLLRAVRVMFSALKLDQPSEALLYTPSIPKADVNAVVLRFPKVAPPVQQPAPVQPTTTQPQPGSPVTVINQRSENTSQLQPQQPAPIPSQQFGGNDKRADISQSPQAPAAPTPPTAAPPTPDSQSESGTPHFLLFPNAAMKQGFGAAYAGQMVSFEMQKIVQVFDPVNGHKQFEFYANPQHQYPAIKYVKPEYVKDLPTQNWLASIQGEITGRWRVVCYVSVKGDKVYFNPNKVVAISDNVPPELIDQTPAQPLGHPPPVPATPPAPPVQQAPVLPTGQPPVDNSPIGATTPPPESITDIPF